MSAIVGLLPGKFFSVMQLSDCGRVVASAGALDDGHRAAVTHPRERYGSILVHRTNAIKIELPAPPRVPCDTMRSIRRAEGFWPFLPWTLLSVTGVTDTGVQKEGCDDSWESAVWCV